jgi:N-methylhydantoinase B/oxoprolinase/acetone carboxylase alpha subunit
VRGDGSTHEMPGKFSTRLREGERVRIESPGGGGWGSPGSTTLMGRTIEREKVNFYE